MAIAELGAAALVSGVLLAYANVLKYRMYLRAVERYVERYAESIEDHEHVIDYAKAIRPATQEEVAHRAVSARKRKTA